MYADVCPEIEKSNTVSLVSVPKIHIKTLLLLSKRHIFSLKIYMVKIRMQNIKFDINYILAS